MRRFGRALSEPDRAAWAKLAAGVRPLAGRERAAAAPIPSAPLVQPPPPSAPQTVLKPAGPLASLVIGAAPAGLDAGSWRRLVAGRMEAQRRLDLHGMTLQHAYAAFQETLAGAVADGLRCVEVITGQGVGGNGVLRRELAGWLDRPEVRRLILAATHPHARNPGSVLLLLKRRR